MVVRLEILCIFILLVARNGLLVAVKIQLVAVKNDLVAVRFILVALRNKFSKNAPPASLFVQ